MSGRYREFLLCDFYYNTAPALSLTIIKHCSIPASVAPVRRGARELHNRAIDETRPKNA